MISKYSKNVFSFMLRELSIMGPYHIDRVCQNAGIDPYKIEEWDLPFVVKSLSNVLLAYKGKAKAREFVDEMQSMYNIDDMLSNIEEKGNRLEKMIQLGDAQRFAGKFDEADRYYYEVVTLAAQFGMKWVECRARRKAAQLYIDNSLYEKARKNLEAALPICEELEANDELAKLNRELATVNWRLGHLDSALEHIERACDLGAKVGDDDLVGSIITRKAMIVNDLGESDTAVLLLKETIGLLRTTSDLLGVARAYNNIGVILRHHGKMDEALKYFKLGLDAATKAENRRMRAYPLANIAKCEVMMGNICSAKSRVAEAKEIFQDMGETYMLTLLKGLEAWIADSEGRTEDADRLLKDAISMFRHLNVPTDLGWELYEAGILYQKWGREGADDYFKEAEDIFIKLKNAPAVERVRCARDGEIVDAQPSS